MVDAYRDKAERPPLGPNERRWFTKRDDEVKGPFEEEMLVRTVTAGRLLRSTLVRMEGETDWRPLKDVPELERQTSPLLTDEAPGGRRGGQRRTGSYRAGLAIGLVAGLIGLVIVHLSALGTETRRGARNGMWIQWAAILTFKVLLVLLSQRAPIDLDAPVTSSHPVYAPGGSGR